MNPEIALLREVCIKVTQMLAGMGIRVTQQGTQAYVETDRRTLKPIRVNIPYIPDNATEELILAIQGFIDHEVAHILFTDWTVVKKAHKLGPAIEVMHNIIEDTFIERAMEKKFPGSVWNLGKLHHFFVKHITKPALLRPEVASNLHNEFGVLIVPMARAWAGQRVFDDFLKAEGYWKRMEPYVEKIGKLALEFPKVKSSQEALDLAIKIDEALNKKAPTSSDGSKGKSEERAKDKSAGTGEEKADRKPEAEEKAPASAEPEAETDDPIDDDRSEDPVDDSSDDAPAPEPDEEDDGDGEESKVSADEAEEDTADGDRGEPEPDDEDGDEDADSSGSGPGEEEGEEEEEEEEEGGSSVGEPSDDESAGESSGGGSLDGHEDPEIGEPDGESEESDEIEGNWLDLIDAEALKSASFDEAAAAEIGKGAIYAARTSEYLVFSKDFDVIKPFEVKKTSWRDEWLTDLEDKTRYMVGVMQKDIERMMAARSQVLRIPGFRRGRLHGAALYRLKTGDTRVFRRLQENRSKDLVVGVLIDNSGSMTGSKMHTAMAAGYALSQTLERVGVRHEVLGFTTLEFGTFGMAGVSTKMIDVEERRIGRPFSRYEPLYMPIFKGFDERLTPQVKQRFAAAPYTRYLANNVDGECVENAVRRLLKERAERRVLLVLSDGRPQAAGNIWEQTEHLRRVVGWAESVGVETIAVGILTDAPRHFYPKHVVLHSLNALPTAVMEQLKRILI